MLSKRLKDYIGVLIILAALLFAATSAMSMDRTKMLTMFFGNISKYVTIGGDYVTLGGDKVKM